MGATVRRIFARPWVSFALILLVPQATEFYRRVRADSRYSIPPIVLRYREQTEWRDEDEPRVITRVIAYRADGAYAEVEIGAAGNTIVRRLRFPDGTAVTVYDRLREKRTSRSSKSEFKLWRNREHFYPGDCLENLLGSSRGFRKTGGGTRAGLRAVKLEDERFGTELWLARDLGCVETSRIENYGKFTSTRQLQSFERRDPDDRLFQVPPDYQELR